METNRVLDIFQVDIRCHFFFSCGSRNFRKYQINGRLDIQVPGLYLLYTVIHIHLVVVTLFIAVPLLNF